MTHASDGPGRTRRVAQQTAPGKFCWRPRDSIGDGSDGVGSRISSPRTSWCGRGLSPARTRQRSVPSQRVRQRVRIRGSGPEVDKTGAGPPSVGASDAHVAEPRAPADVSLTYPLHTHSRSGRTGIAAGSAVPATPDLGNRCVAEAQAGRCGGRLTKAIVRFRRDRSSVGARTLWRGFEESGSFARCGCARTVSSGGDRHAMCC